MGKITINHIKKSFHSNEILKGIDVEIQDGSFTILLGPSGCGKSTLLRIIAGLEEPTSGSLLINDEDVTYAEPKDRNIAMVFQNYALYPHMTVYKNIEYGLKIKKVPKHEREEIIQNVLNMVELTEHANKRPAQLSGGQRQRVALARAIVKRPHAFLMDEPLSNLDAKLRNQMRQELIDLHQQLKTTFLYVTHDQVEAMSMGSYIIIMNQGEIMQQGTPKEIYTNPANLFVAQFIGSPPTNIIEFDNIYIGIRPEDITILNKNDFNSDAILSGEILTTEQLGGETIYRVKTKVGNLNIRTQSCWDEIGKFVEVQFSFDKLMVFDKQGNRIEKDETILDIIKKLLNVELNEKELLHV
ncbi:ABC transporter ATP-binding protein [Metabacillus sp. Hm71]|uniref:ABC transporter ATP-binding protein n=1 Tax=Metabacillus sp. Hm71 TaxID=3450743 RepID=UPI003F42A1D7